MNGKKLLVIAAVVGGVIVYFDRGHLSETFARSLGPDVWAAMQALRRDAGK